MMAAVATADAIVVNPTHYAVAIAYDRAKDRAPRVVAKGVDMMAARIREQRPPTACPSSKTPSWPERSTLPATSTTSCLPRSTPRWPACSPSSTPSRRPPGHCRACTRWQWSGRDRSELCARTGRRTTWPGWPGDDQGRNISSSRTRGPFVHDSVHRPLTGAGRG